MAARSRSELWRAPATKRAAELELVRVGRRLRSLREAKGWTLEQTAERATIHAVSLSRIECGKTNVTVGTLVALARALGVHVGSLFGDVTVVRRT